MMRGEGTEIVGLEADRLGQAAAMLGRAFDDDPMSAYLFPDAANRQRKLAWSMGCMLRFAMDHGVVETTTAMDGLAAWIRSDLARLTGWQMLRCGMWAAPFRFGPGGWRRFSRMVRTTFAAQSRLPKQAHWYLMLLAVDPARQRGGLGTQLLRRGIERAERDGLPCRLETTTPRAKEFYEKHGFRVVLDVEIPGSGVTIWTMVRETGA